MPTGSPIDPLGMYNWNITPVGPGQTPTTPTQNVGYVAPTNFTQTNFGQFTAPNMSVSAGQGHSGLQEESVAYQGSQASGLTYKNNLSPSSPMTSPGSPNSGINSLGQPVSLTPSGQLMTGNRIGTVVGLNKENMNFGETSANNAANLWDSGDHSVDPVLALQGGAGGTRAGDKSLISAIKAKFGINRTTLGTMHRPAPIVTAAHVLSQTPNKLLSQSAMRVPDVPSGLASSTATQPAAPSSTPTLSTTPSVVPKITNSIRPIISKSATWR